MPIRLRSVICTSSHSASGPPSRSNFPESSGHRAHCAAHLQLLTILRRPSSTALTSWLDALPAAVILPNRCPATAEAAIPIRSKILLSPTSRYPYNQVKLSAARFCRIPYRLLPTSNPNRYAVPVVVRPESTWSRLQTWKSPGSRSC